MISQWYALFVAMLGMMVTFTVWGALSPLATLFQNELLLNHTQVSILIAIPVLLGSVMRIPMGMLTDRYGGKRVFIALLIFSLLPTFVLGTLISSYSELLVWAFVLGMAGTSFAVGIPFVSKWFPPGHQGLALGIFGIGNGGTAISAFFAPRIAQASCWPHVFLWFSLPICLVIILFFFTKDAPTVTKTQSWSTIKSTIRNSPLVWVLSLFYFVTFGSFVAFSTYLPKLLVDIYGFPKTTSGSIAALFVVTATIGRPLGGWLSDKFSGERVLRFIFLFIVATGLALASDLSVTIFPKSIYALGFIVGIGNGAVFKLVPQFFDRNTGIVTGIVGAAGGLGGFFPPLFLGVSKDYLGSYTMGFLFLSGFSLLCLLVHSNLQWKNNV